GEGAHVTPSQVNCRVIPPTCLPGATNHAACRNLRARSSFPINDESPRDSSSRGRPPVWSRSGKASGRRSRRRRRGGPPGPSRFRRCPANEELVLLTVDPNLQFGVLLIASTSGGAKQSVGLSTSVPVGRLGSCPDGGRGAFHRPALCQ